MPTELSAPVHDTLDRLITTNRRVNYRVAPPLALAATLRVEAGTLPVAELSRTHGPASGPTHAPESSTWLRGVLGLAVTEIPISV